MSSYTLATRINNLEQIAEDVYTKGQTDTKLFELINGAPDSLNTLYELSRAINDDPQFYQDISNSIAGKQDTFSASNRLNASFIGGGAVTSTEFNFLDGVSSNIQAQLTNLGSTKQNNIVNSSSIYSIGNNQFGVYANSQGRYNLNASQTSICWYRVCNISLGAITNQISFELVGTNEGSLQDNFIKNFRLWINFMCGNQQTKKDSGNLINGYMSGDMFGDITCFVLGPKDYKPLEIRLLNNTSLGNNYDLYIKLGANAGHLSFTSSMPEYVTFYGTALAINASPPFNVPYQIATIFNVFNDLNLPDFQKVIVNSNSIVPTTDFTLDVIPSSQGRYTFTSDTNYYTWYHICHINTQFKKKYLHGTNRNE